MRIAGLWSTTDGRVLYWVVEHHGTGDIDADWRGFHADPRWTENLSERTKDGSFVACMEKKREAAERTWLRPLCGM